MATSAAQAEADRAALAFHLALTKVGVDTLADALVLWNEVPANARPEMAARWLDSAVALVMTRRGLSRQLALVYYRLVRALRTGTTIPDPRKPEPTSVSLETLRREFAALTGPAQTPSGPAPTRDTEVSQREPDAPSTPVETPPEDDEADRIPIEEIAGLDAELARVEAAAEQEARTSLAALGPINQAKLIEAIGDERSASEVDALRDDANLRAGARQAAAAERVARDGARSQLWTYIERDKRAVGYVRYSTSGTPCGFCAMLISRKVLYRSEKSATFSDGDKYHDNCHCEALPVFSREEYDDSSLYELNRKYAKEWPVVTKGLSGKAALTAWRYFIRQEQKNATRDLASRTTP